MLPANISTLDQCCFNIVDQNKTKSDLGFSTFHNVNTTSVLDVEKTLEQRYKTPKQRCTTLVQR